MSISTSGRASRSFIIGSRLWPPAMSRASGPWRSSSAERVVDARGALVFDRRRYLHGSPSPCLPGGTVAPPATPVNTGDKRSLIVVVDVTLTQLEAFVLVARLGLGDRCGPHPRRQRAGRVGGAGRAAPAARRPPGRARTAGHDPHRRRAAAGADRVADGRPRRRGRGRHPPGPGRPRAPPRGRDQHGRRVGRARPAGRLRRSRPGRWRCRSASRRPRRCPPLLQERLADVALGPQVCGEPDLESRAAVPLPARVLVAAPGHPLAGAGRMRLRALAAQTWLVGPDATDGATPVGGLLRRLGVPRRERAGVPQPGRGVGGGGGRAGRRAGRSPTWSPPTSPAARWWCSTSTACPSTCCGTRPMLGADPPQPGRGGAGRFIATPDATHAMHAPTAGVPPSRFRPPVYVTLWS